MRTLILYSTIDGQTRKIADRIAESIEGAVDVVNVADFERYEDKSQVSRLVIGTAIRYGRVHRSMQRFVIEQAEWLSQMRPSFFLVNLTARKPEKRDPAQNRPLQKFLLQTGLQPERLVLFAGKLDYPNYRFWDKQCIRFIMTLTDGCNDGISTIEYTDWDAVADFARQISVQSA